MEANDEELQHILDADENMLTRSNWDKQRSDFLNYLEAEERTIKGLIGHHLTLRQDQISENCAYVLIPTLRGFGLPNGLSFTPFQRIPWYRRIWEHVKRSIRCLWEGYIWRPFLPAQHNLGLESGYLLMDFVEKYQGELLSDKGPFPTVETRQAFLQSLSRVLIDLGRPMDKIGSFTVHDSGEVSLNNRPLTSALATFDNNGIPTMSTTTCYTSTDSYITGLLDCHDSRLEHQPNAVRDEHDAEGQMAVIVILRALLARLTQRPLRNGPFIFQFTDLHPRNIFVDEKYRITAICDLEWSCSLPIEMQQPPLWLTGYTIDDFLVERDEERAEKEKELEKFYDTFLEIFARECSHMGCGFIDRSGVMKSALERKSHWYFAGLRNPSIAYDVFTTLLQPLFAPPEQSYGDGSIVFQRTLAPYWKIGISGFTNQKCRELKEYKCQLRSEYLTR